MPGAGGLGGRAVPGGKGRARPGRRRYCRGGAVPVTLPTAIREVALHRARLPLPEPFTSAVVRVEAVHLVIARVTTEGGLTGLASAFAFSRRDAAMIAACLTQMTDLVLGQDAADPQALWQRLASALVFVGAGGPALAALSVLDMAAWDIRARAADLPLHFLLGAGRDRVPAYASGGSTAASVAELCDEVAGYAAQGFSQAKIKLRRAPAENAARLAALREAVGWDMTLYVDGNQQWMGPEAIEAARALLPFAPGWLEEPVGARDFAALREVHRAGLLPLATGETNFGETELTRLIEDRSADVLMPNLQRLGGITAWLRVADAAHRAGLRVASHVNPQYALPLLCAAPNATTLEYIPWWPNPFNEELQFRDGQAVAFDGPGFGVTLDDARLRHNPD